MKIFVAILSVFVLTSSSIAADDQRSVKYAVGALSRDGLELRRNAKEISPCIVRALRGWMQRPFVIVDQGQAFPPVTDIRRTGDGQFRLLFFSELSPETTLLCFEDNSSLGISYRAFFFSKRGNKCVVEHQFALRHPARSIKEVRAAIIKSAKHSANGKIRTTTYAVFKNETAEPVEVRLLNSSGKYAQFELGPGGVEGFPARNGRVEVTTATRKPLAKGPVNLNAKSRVSAPIRTLYFRIRDGRIEAVSDEAARAWNWKP